MASKTIKCNSIKILSFFMISIIFIFASKSVFAERLMDEQAIEYFKQALEAQKSGDMENALSLYTKTIVLKPNYTKAHNNLGTIYAKKGNYTKAEEEYRQAIMIDPQYKTALMNLALIYLEKRDFEKFYEYWKRASGLDIYSPFLIDEDKD